MTSDIDANAAMGTTPLADDSGDEDDRDDALMLSTEVCMGREIFGTTRATPSHLHSPGERAHIFDAAAPDQTKIHPDWSHKVTPNLLESHVGPLLGDKYTLHTTARA